jgi:hypothetical protein
MGCGARWIVFRSIFWGLAALLAVTAGSWRQAAAAPQASDAAAVHAEIHRVYDWAGYQREMPAGDDEDEPKPQPRRLYTLNLGPLPTVILVGLVLIALFMVASWLRSGGWDRLFEATASGADEEVPAKSQRDQLKDRLSDADRFASAGDWAAAIHVLLLTSIDLLRRKVGQAIPAAMTARELVGRAQVATEARADLAALVSASELCHFGGRPADRALYDRCRTHYERLWGMPPEALA